MHGAGQETMPLESWDSESKVGARFECERVTCNDGPGLLPMNPRRLRLRLPMSVRKMYKVASSGHCLYFLLSFRSKKCNANDV